MRNIDSEIEAIFRDIDRSLYDQEQKFLSRDVYAFLFIKIYDNICTIINELKNLIKIK